MKNYSASGEVRTVTVAETITSGKVYDLGNGIFGVAKTDGVSGDLVAFCLEGVYTLDITAGDTAEAGDPAYYSPITNGASVIAVGPKIGVFVADVGSGDDTAEVYVDGIPGTVFVEGVAILNATAGLAIGTHSFGPEVPKGARLISTFVKVFTTFTSATDAATLALGVVTDDATGIFGAVAISNGANPWDSGTFAQSATTDAAPSPVTTARRRFLATVAVEAITAGRLAVIYRYAVTG